MRIVVDRTTFCAKCHRIGDYSPGGETQTILAPDLAQVGRRIRPEYLRRWLADPRSILPYTGMPVNFPPEGAALGQDLMPAASRDQLEAAADLLLHSVERVSRPVAVCEPATSPQSGSATSGRTGLPARCRLRAAGKTRQGRAWQAAK